MNRPIVQSRMSRLMMIAICVLFVCTACGNGTSQQKKAAETRKAEVSAVEADNNQDGLIKQFHTVVKGAKDASDIVSFLNENINKAGQNNADIMIRELNVFYQNDLQMTQDAFFKDDVQTMLLALPAPITSANAAAISDESIRQLVVTKLSGGYKLVEVEGSIFPIVDYEMQKIYRTYLSQPLIDYIYLKAVESNEMSARDGGLVISWDDLAKRAIMAESFLRNHPDSPEYEEVTRLYLDSYLSMYIFGLNNTPVFDYDTFKLQDEVRASYEKLIQNEPDTVTAATVQKFLDVLSQTEGRVFENVNGEQKQIPLVSRFHGSFRATAESMLQSYAGRS